MKEGSFGIEFENSSEPLLWSPFVWVGLLIELVFIDRGRNTYIFFLTYDKEIPSSLLKQRKWESAEKSKYISQTQFTEIMCSFTAEET